MAEAIGQQVHEALMQKLLAQKRTAVTPDEEGLLVHIEKNQGQSECRCHEIRLADL